MSRLVDIGLGVLVVMLAGAVGVGIFALGFMTTVGLFGH